MARLTMFIALCAVFLRLAAAYPNRYALTYAFDNCTAHPAKGYAMHRAPSENATSGITFVVTNPADGSIPSSVCPGLTYDVTVALPASSHFLVTASSARSSIEASVASGCQTSQCPNRYCVPVFNQVQSQAFKLALPCNTTDSSVTVKVTMAESMMAQYLWNTLTLPYATEGCPDTATLNCTDAPSPPPVTPPSMSITPNSTSIYIKPTKAGQRASRSFKVKLANLPADDDGVRLSVTVPRALRAVATCRVSEVDAQGAAVVTCARRAGASLARRTTGTVVVRLVGEDLLARAALTVFP